MRFFNGHEHSANWHNGNAGRACWWTMPYDLQVIELGGRASDAIDKENDT